MTPVRHLPYVLDLINPFGIARSTKSRSDVVLVRLDGGWGEAAPVSFYGESAATVAAAIDRAAAEVFRDGADLNHIEDISEALDRLLPLDPVTRTGNQCAKAALDIALHDRLGRRLGVPLHVLFGRAPRADTRYMTSFTIGIDTMETMMRKVDEAGAYAILKIKLGADLDHDLKVMKAIRAAAPGKTLRVDANAGYTLDQARTALPALADLGVEYVEQPLAKGNIDGMRALKKDSPLPLFVDEDSMTSADLPRLDGAVDGINIKLMKSGGLVEARRMIAMARAYGFQIMIGCMIETNVAITAAAHLAPFADHLDLDGNLLISNDPFTGATCDPDGRIRLPDGPGLGVAVKPEYAEAMAGLAG